MDNFQEEEERRWPLGPDVADECEAVASLPEVDPSEWVPLFEPTSFSSDNAPLEVDRFRLSAEELKEWSERSARIR